ncbi:sugar phosphate isomerase/epimerase family protein [Paenibacillus sp. XY044]|uniref:sugar phosphate isomerase/epimerase family protein n=1 Tax=Paenibacillus sp. XY044 TaxID=2026089 RepID=UPI000B99BD1B|nr:sugar phosphate isomerase/epimerase family protein [Paenibacillus sp. XY044]OZB95443.1 xylose isomerase [Paenibacillus sp. XY044]
MKKGLTKAGIGNVDDVLFIQKAAEYGFAAVDLDMRSIMNEAGVDKIKRTLDTNGIVIGAVDLGVDWRNGSDAFARDLSKLPGYAAAANQLEIPAFTTYILPSTDEKPALYMAKVVHRLRDCAKILGSHGIKLALEFVGPLHLRTAWKHPFIWTIDETLELIDAIDLPNVGLLLDCYHCYTTEMGTERWDTLRPEQIVHVHINDAKDKPIDQLQDNERLYPGEGVIDVGGFLRSLDRLGYDGVVSQEVLSQEEPDTTVDALFERSRTGFARAFDFGR